MRNKQPQTNASVHSWPIYCGIGDGFSETCLQEAAGIANMHSTAFCRYFQRRTNKTVIRFINELRIGYAHKLLLEKELNTAQVCYACGFNHVSNFYEQFQKTTGKSPHKFRKDHYEKQLMLA